MIYSRQPCGVTPFADGYKLVHGHEATEPDAGLDVAMSAYLGIVAEDHFVFENAVVPDVHAYHNEIIVAELCKFAGIDARMDRYLLADDVVIADDKASFFGFFADSEQLRRPADDAVGI